MKYEEIASNLLTNDFIRGLHDRASTLSPFNFVPLTREELSDIIGNYLWVVEILKREMMAKELDIRSNGFKNTEPRI